MNIEKEIRKIVKENVKLDISIDEVSQDESLLTLGVDSISMIKIILNIEEVFEFTFEDEDLISDNFKSIERLVNYVKRRIQS